MTTGMVQDQNLEKHIEKQMGCMAGFLQIFDRHQLLAGKRLVSAKGLPPSVSVDSTSESEKSVGSPAMSRELEKCQNVRSMPSPDRSKQPPVATELRSPVPENHKTSSLETLPPKSPLPLSVFEFKEGTRSSWKFAREAPRLSLDSRATVDAKGSLYPREIRTNAAILSANRCEKPPDGEDDGDNQRRSPSVIARLMGLEPLQHSDPELMKKAELRRSASESRVSKDLYQYRFVDGNAFPAKQSQQMTHAKMSGNVIRDNDGNEDRSSNFRPADPKMYAKAEPVKVYQQKGIGQRKSCFDSADFFPEPKQTSSVYGEIEKRLKMRGIDEPSKDLETLKQILEALQLKGLLHPRKPSNQMDYRNFVYDRSFSHDESPIVVMKPVRLPAATSRSPRIVDNQSPPPSGFRSRSAGARRNMNLAGDSVSPKCDRRDIDRSPRIHSPGRYSSPPARNESGVKSPNRRRPLSIEIQRKGNDVAEHRRVSPVHSPKLNSRRISSEQPQTPNRSPRNRKPTAEIHRKEAKVLPTVEDESSTMSESSISTSTDTDRAKTEEYKEGKSLLERCDKLLHSIAEITTTTTTELQTSPVSVLDSSFYKDESSTSPIMKRTIDFKDQPSELEEETIWGSESKSDDQSEDCDLVYISEILRASNYLPEDSDIFLLLEEKQYLKGNDTSKVSRLQRRLIFDTINEIVNRNRQLPPWKVVSPGNSTSLQQVWSEFRRIRERDESEDLFEVICGVLKKDLAGDAVHGWGDCPIEVSEAVLDIERLIFKDLIGETIRDLAAFSVKSYKPSPSCRKLVF
ncbi:hypothetical protein TIFTF001_018044 [Ficus carica]|uniref:DUF4378 domain-containing protein n=1 Tax=Ficus carica TaxID=3494 RepID=A0AA88ADC6_FICCA|nr:hypothetical protein TIFTF001_018044 [Ficus carica]